MSSLRTIALACLAAAVAAGAVAGTVRAAVPAAAPPAGFAVGAADDGARFATDVAEARARLDLAHGAGLDTIRITDYQWRPGAIAPTPDDLLQLQRAVGAADASGVRVVLAVYNAGSRTTPRTPLARAQFVAYTAALARALPQVRDFVVGNEPNLNLYWLPQFGRRGSDVAAQAYEALLARAYDALKAVSPAITVIGGALAPRGGDRPGTGRPTHSPTAFIRDLGRAYRASGRRRPIMDEFSFHPYGENSRVSPSLQRPRSTSIGLGDYGKLVALLGSAFDGTAQAGSTLPIVYDEFGIQSQIPAAKAGAYTNTWSRAAADAVSEAVQAARYAEALRLAACQPNVQGLMFFHVQDESDLSRWQSGLYYADGTPKTSLAPVRASAAAAESGNLTSCGASPPKLGPAATLAFAAAVPEAAAEPTDPAVPDLAAVEPADPAVPALPAPPLLSCSGGCQWEAAVVSEETGERTQTGTGTLSAVETAPTPVLEQPALPPGDYRYVVRYWSLVGATRTEFGPVFTVAAPPPPPPADGAPPVTP